jgi:hypothetical protein
VVEEDVVLGVELRPQLVHALAAGGQAGTETISGVFTR